MYIYICVLKNILIKVYKHSIVAVILLRDVALVIRCYTVTIDFAVIEILTEKEAAATLQIPRTKCFVYFPLPPLPLSFYLVAPRN